MTNPYSGNEPYGTAWQQGHDYGGANPGATDQPTPPDHSGWGYDAATTGYLGQVWQEGVLAGRTATTSGSPAAPAGSAAPATEAGHHGAEHDTAHAGADAGTAGEPQVQHDQPPAPGPVAVVEPSGAVVEHGHATELHRAGTVQESSHLLEAAVQAAISGSLLIPGIGALVEAVNLAHQLGCTVAIGMDGELAAIVGLDVGRGIYYTPSGQFGEYMSLAGDLGAVLGVSISEALTVVYGEADALAGSCFAVTVGGGEIAVGSGSALFSLDSGGFIGVAGSLGVGLGWPVAAFAQFGHTWIRPIG